MDEMNKGLKPIFILITGMTTGMMIGILIMNTVISYRIDQYHEKIKYLENIILVKDTRLKNLEQSVNKKKFILKDIEIVLMHDGDRIEKIVLEKHIKEKYSKLIGKEVKSIDTDILVEVIDKRIMIIGSSKYRLKLARMVLTETLNLWIHVEEE